MQEKAPVDDSYVRFCRAMEGFAPFESSPRLAVALSGGSDSLALLHLATRWAATCQAQVTALTVDHDLRSNSRAEAETVGNWVRALGHSHHILTWKGAKPATGIQAAARSARYQLMEDWCRDHDVLHLMVAHTRDDQAETYLMRKHHGSGPDGMAAMSAVRELTDCRLLRPLLAETRETLRDGLRSRGVNWIEDPSNADPAYERVRWRNHIAGENLALADLADTVADFAARRVRANQVLVSQIAPGVSLSPMGYATIGADVLENLPPLQAGRLLARVLSVIGGGLYPPDQKKTNALCARMNRMDSGSLTLGGCHVSKGAGGLHILREGRNLPLPHLIHPGDTVSWDRRFRMRFGKGPDKSRGKVYLRAFAEDDWPVLKPCFMAAPTGVRPLDICRGLPVVADEIGVLAAPHLNYRRTQMEKSQKNAGDLIRFLSFSPSISLSGGGFSVA
ncbi:MAG: tRNA lysidine(34) synthetase TilS [Rhodospirillales bacterium]|nr:tRNA lysidine(34) synthetase TilS [Rhodospirillales bacterium]